MENLTGIDHYYLVTEPGNHSSIPLLTLIENRTYCYNQDVRAYVRCFFSNLTKIQPPENRTWVSGTEFCLDSSSSLFLLCQPSIQPGPLYQIPLTIVILLSLCYGFISLMAIVGNSLVMYVVAVSRRMQTVTNFYIANLALADVILAMFCIPFQFRAALVQRWDLPVFMCQFCPFVQILSVNVSIWTLVAICMDRYQAIMHPMSVKQSKGTARLVILCIWGLGAVTALPMGVAHTYDQVLDNERGGVKPFCSVRWSSLNVEDTMKQVPLEARLFWIYCILLVSLEYLMPLMVISVCYFRMGLKLWWSETPGQADQLRDDKILKNKKKVVKMLVLVVAAFALCWAPWQTYFLAAVVHPPVNHWKYINIMFFMFHWLAMSNSCYNPAIYGIFGEKFQREFRVRLACCLPCWEGEQGIHSPVDSELEPNGLVSRMSRRCTSATTSGRQRLNGATLHDHTAAINDPVLNDPVLHDPVLHDLVRCGSVKCSVQHPLELSMLPTDRVV